jgi:hypothetical protein
MTQTQIGIEYKHNEPHAHAGIQCRKSSLVGCDLGLPNGAYLISGTLMSREILINRLPFAPGVWSACTSTILRAAVMMTQAVGAVNFWSMVNCSARAAVAMVGNPTWCQTRARSCVRRSISMKNIKITIKSTCLL